MSDATDPNDPYWTPGIGKKLATGVALAVVGGMLALIATHLAFGWPA